MKKAQAALQSVSGVSTAGETDGTDNESENGPFKDVTEELQKKYEALVKEPVKELPQYDV